MNHKIKLFDPHISNNEKKSIMSVLTSKYWASGDGSNLVAKFEKNFQDYIGAKSCVAVNSGTAALHLALSLENIPNKEVILPSLSFVSTANAVLYNKGKVKFADIDPDTLNIDPDSVKKNISNNTKVILPVHFGGLSADLKKLELLAQQSNSSLIDDAAHAAGSKFNGKNIGSIGDISCFSFHPVKNLAMPTGGLIALNNKNSNLSKKLLLARRWCGITARKGTEYDVKELGWNYYMNEFSAAIGIEQLTKLNKLNAKRFLVAKKFFEKINLERKMPLTPDCSYHFYWILVKNRTKFRKKMNEIGIETGIHYKPIHKMTLYQGQSLPVTEQISNEIVSLPTHPNLSQNDVDFIIESVNDFL